MVSLWMMEDFYTQIMSSNWRAHRIGCSAKPLKLGASRW